MRKRNVTLSMPADLIRRAKALAAARDKSLSELLRESLEEKVSEASGYRQAMDRQLKLLATGFDLGLRGKVTWSRDSVIEPENLLIEIGMVLKESGVSREESLRALKAVGKVVYD